MVYSSTTTISKYQPTLTRNSNKSDNYDNEVIKRKPVIPEVKIEIKDTVNIIPEEIVLAEDEDNLNLDSELESKSELDQEKPKSKINKEECEISIMKTISLQDITNDVVAIDKNWYNDFKEYINLPDFVNNRRQINHTQAFMKIRLYRIISNSKQFSKAFYEKLSSEEQELYINLCNNVKDFERKILEKINK